MKLMKNVNIENETSVYTLEITKSDLLNMYKLDNFDLMLLKDCEKENATISDKLLALETIARRVEQGYKENKGREEKQKPLTLGGRE